MYVVKFTPQGQPVNGFGYNSSGAVCIGGSGDEAAKSIVEIRNHCLVLAGYTESYGSGGKDMYILKLNSNGEGCNTKPAGVTVHAGGGTFHGNCTSGTQNVFDNTNGTYKYHCCIELTRICH